MFLAGLHLLLNAAGAMAGVAASRRSLRLAALLGFLLLGVILAKFAIAMIPAAEANLFPWDFYPLVERWWFFPLVFFLLGAGMYAARKSMWRRDLLLVMGGLLLLRVGDIVWADAAPRPVLEGKLNPYGFCPQTSEYSCGAAAAVMFLYLNGIDSYEEEMARLCVTRSGLGGTTEAGVIRGLKRKGLRVKAVTAEEITAPCMASVKIDWLVSHWVVVVEVLPDHVRLADPMNGFSRWKKDIFMSRWHGSMVVVEEE